jgi:hypothetical protein
MKLRSLLVAASAAAVTALNAQAVQYGNYELAGLVGSGSSTSVCVFDFGATEYAFGYRYDGTTQTGKDMLNALNGNFGVTVAYSSWGIPTTISYNGHAITNDPIDGEFTGSPFYYASGGTTVNEWVVPVLVLNYAGGGTGGPTWATSDTGLADRYLVNGSWDGWVQGKFDTNWTGYSAAPNGAFATVIPEPTTLGLLALGGLALLRRRR